MTTNEGSFLGIKTVCPQHPLDLHSDSQKIAYIDGNDNVIILASLNELCEDYGKEQDILYKAILRLIIEIARLREEKILEN